MKCSAAARGFALLLAALAIGAFALPARAKLVEEHFKLPVEVADAYGKKVARAIVVTVFVDDETPQPRPVVVLNHGRAPTVAGRAAVGRSRYPEASAWFAQQGFVVALPTRIGYGETGGEDVEDTGRCERTRYLPGFAAAADQALAVLSAMRARPDVAPERAIVAGQSFGGAASIAAAAQAPAGLVAAINFSGGGGGNPAGAPGEPCQPRLLQRLFARYGETARSPTLWVYAENDQYFGADYPRRWFEAFTATGGMGEFVLLPPQGRDGHPLLGSYQAAWQPLVAAFLRKQGFEIKE
ncbi:alpha/beta hydrolase family protein [Aquabacterium humicola]|uniref:alpha/beta hydrolase family protein n=1 Tax=Aquabacterium humicola TaxID=3237377 RepID=UPI002542FE29|nr:alpha/beta hydrolase [Rubrivivax pictus]